MRRALTVLVLAVAGSGCADIYETADGSVSWRNPEFLEQLVGEPSTAFAAHVRYAVFQEHGAGSFVDSYSDRQLIDLAVLWCQEGPTPFSTVLRDELERLGLDANPSGAFLPPPPIWVLINRVADMHQPGLCVSMGLAPAEE